jgi:23S rRNA pseudouridine1911/1915/1917 synthase
VNERGKGLFEVIHEDGEFLVINKPAGLVCHPTKTDEYSSLISRARLYLGPGARPQLINRLDRETSGVTLLAKSEDAARRLRGLWESRQVRKEYLAVVHGKVAETHKLVVARLGKDEQSPVAIKDCVRDDGAEAQTEFWLEKSFEKDISVISTTTPESDNHGPVPVVGATRSFSLLKVVPHTGRKHQIRIHLSHLGYPIVGDKLYGGDEDLYLALVENRLTEEQRSRLILPHHALHAAEVRFHWNGLETVFRAEPEPWFKAFCSSGRVPD